MDMGWSVGKTGRLGVVGILVLAGCGGWGVRCKLVEGEGCSLVGQVGCNSVEQVGCSLVEQVGCSLVG